MCIFDFLKVGLKIYGIYLFHRSDIGEIGPSQPIHTSLLPETDRLSSQNTTGFRSQYSEDQKLQPPMASVQDNESFIKREAEKKTSTTEGTQRSRMNRIRRGVIAGPISSTLQVLDYWWSSWNGIDSLYYLHHTLFDYWCFSFKESNKKRPNRRLEGPQQLLRREEENMQSKDGLLVTGVHQKSSKSGVKSADCLGGQWESWSAPDSFEKVQQDIPTTTK